MGNIVYKSLREAQKAQTTRARSATDAGDAQRRNNRQQKEDAPSRGRRLNDTITEGVTSILRCVAT